MDWPAGVKAEALFSSDVAHNIMNPNDPVWSLLDSNNPSNLKHLIEAKLGELGSQIPEDVEFLTTDERKGPVHVAEGATIEAHVHLIGPCLIESNATIRSHAYVREYTWMMSGSLLGHASESKHSLFFPGARLHISITLVTLFSVQTSTLELESNSQTYEMMENKSESGSMMFGEIQG